MPECNACGGFVTPDFARVFGDNTDEVYGCSECLSAADILGGKIVDKILENGDTS